MPVFTFDWHTTKDDRSGYIAMRCESPHRAMVLARREVRARKLEDRYDLDAIKLELRLAEPDAEQSHEPHDERLEPDFDAADSDALPRADDDSGA
jgi:hypothetical protein